MKKVLLLLLMIGSLFILNAEEGYPDDAFDKEAQQEELILKEGLPLTIYVTAQGVAPAFATSHAQAYVMAKRAATVEAYRIIAERVKGVRVEGQDTIKNMTVKQSVVRTKVSAMIRNAKIVETTFADGLCEVQMEIEIRHEEFMN